MRQVNWRDFQEQCDEFLGLVAAEPITVLKSGKPVAVVISPEEYEHLQRLDDEYWIARAQAAEANADWVEVTREVQDYFVDVAPRNTLLSDELGRDRRAEAARDKRG
jgi:prevent-host-death family protein